jgi:hypothetical protein
VPHTSKKFEKQILIFLTKCEQPAFKKSLLDTR